MPSPGSGTATRTGADGRDGGGVAPHARADQRRIPGGLRPVAVPVLVVVVLAVPLVVALLALRHPRWYPLLDLAQTEMRVRDVGTTHPPLIGLLGRFGSGDHPGSHPGPMSFWFMWPVWAAAGRSSFALRVASVTVHLVAIGAAVAVAWRRGGARMAVGVGALLAVAASTFGVAVFLEPWNPYLPSMWWLVLVLAVWSALCDDWPMLPVAAFAGSFCAQTHASYAGMVGGMAAFTVAFVGFKAYRRRHDRGELRRIAAWTAIAAGIAVVLWVPPLIDQLTASKGNLSIIAEDFLHPPADPIGLRSGLVELLRRLNVLQAFSGLRAGVGETGSIVPGVLLLVAWAGSGAVAWRRREARLNRLNIVAGVALLLSLYSASRIYGRVWYYLLLYGWSLGAVMLLTTGWALMVAFRPGPAAGDGPRDDARDAVHDRPHGADAPGVPAWSWTPATALAATALLVFSTVLGVRASGATATDAMAGAALGEVVAPTATALRARMAEEPLRGERFVVTWTDTVSLGGQGWGLINELERVGIPVGVADVPLYRGGARGHRVVADRDARATVHLAVGTAIDVWRAVPDATEIAYGDPRSRAERAEFRRLHARVDRRLRSGGRDDLLPLLDSQLFLLALAPDLPPEVERDTRRMLELGEPVAVFVAPPGTTA